MNIDTAKAERKVIYETTDDFPLFALAIFAFVEYYLIYISNLLLFLKLYLSKVCHKENIYEK